MHRFSILFQFIEKFKMNLLFYWQIAFFYWYLFLLSHLIISIIEILVGISNVDPIFYFLFYIFLMLTLFTTHDSKNLKLSLKMTLKLYICEILRSQKKIIPAAHSKLLHCKVKYWIIKQNFLLANTLKLSDISIFCGFENIFDEYIVSKIPIHLHQSREVYTKLFNFLNISFKIACIFGDFLKVFFDFFRDKRYDEECVICIEFSEVKITACGHRFCSKCLSKMKNCPICRRIIDKKEIRDIRNCIQARRTIYS